jgi:hypothetical protein
MTLLDLLAATAPADNRSWADWGYDVSKNVVSAAAVAFVDRGRR